MQNLSVQILILIKNIRNITYLDGIVTHQRKYVLLKNIENCFLVLIEFFFGIAKQQISY